MSLSSCTTLLSRAPGKSSPAAALQLRSRQPAAASVVALRWGSRNEPHQSRATNFACHADEDDNKYSVEPSALVHPREFASSDWSLGDDTNRITLGFNVGESTTKDDLDVETTEDQTLLVIKYNKNKNKKKKKKKEQDKSSPGSSLDVRLLMPPGYDINKMRATMLSEGWLQISIPKPKHQRKPIPWATPSTTTTTEPPTTPAP